MTLHRRCYLARSRRCTLESDEPDVVRYVSIELRDERKGVIAIVRCSYSSKEKHIMYSSNRTHPVFDNSSISCVHFVSTKLTNLPKDHWRVLAITNAGRSFMIVFVCLLRLIMSCCCNAIELQGLLLLEKFKALFLIRSLLLSMLKIMRHAALIQIQIRWENEF